MIKSKFQEICPASSHLFERWLLLLRAKNAPETGNPHIHIYLKNTKFLYFVSDYDASSSGVLPDCGKI
jgi:hypothetical protein